MRCISVISIIVLFNKNIITNGQPVEVASDMSSNDYTNTTQKENIRVISNSNVNRDSAKASLHDSAFSGYQVESDEGDVECILGRSELYLSWWIYENGSLRLPSINRTSMSGFLDLSIQLATETSIIEKVLSFTSQYPNEVIRIMSLAHNLLRQIPKNVLLLTSSLQYLSLADNNFYTLFEEEETTFENFTAFPLMSNLLELDLRNCQMTNLKSSYFINLPNLTRLFVSHNYFTVIYDDDVSSLRNLHHLDISYNQIITENGSLYLEKGLFQHLPKLRFLDFSHTILSENSTEALKYLAENVTQMSLCYTNLRQLDKETFLNKNLKVIDLSGNPGLYENLTPVHFQYLDDTLEIFVFRDSKIRDKELFTYLKNLRMLDLRNNEIESLMPFVTLENLEVLDLGNNKISDWMYRLFSFDQKIQVVNLRGNNITVMKQPMLEDFYETSYLAIGNNNYVCACNLRDFMDRATRNTLYRHCQDRSKRSLEANSEVLSFRDQYDVLRRGKELLSSYFKSSNGNILKPILDKRRGSAFDKLGAPENYQIISNEVEKEDDPCFEFNFNKATTMNFDFLLLDFNENDYKCSANDNLGYSARFRFSDIEACPEIDIDVTLPAYEGSSDDLTTTTEFLNGEIDDDEGNESSSREYVLLNWLIIIPIVVIGFVWYWKRRDINYFLSLFKNSLILSFDADDKKSLMMSNRKTSLNSFDQFTYDVFVSYSDNDRAWVLDELIPNMENPTDINICLHERDFQVGLSILENIIQCMDKSRCLLLVVSESFLKSNWCAFEMHLAQHRLIETRREQLILVLLHDIPRARRSRTLHYLMRTKTYIMWPNDGKEESKTMFWKRLKKAIVLNDVNSQTNTALKKQRHSIV